MSFETIAAAATGIRPTPEYKFHPSRRWRFDWAFVRAKIALEVDGGIWKQGRHTRGSGFIKDMEKLNEAAILGWLVLRCTPTMFNNGEAIELVRRAIDGMGNRLEQKKANQK